MIRKSGPSFLIKRDQIDGGSKSFLEIPKPRLKRLEPQCIVHPKLREEHSSFSLSGAVRDVRRAMAASVPPRLLESG
jgi:hypothetical protein